MVTHFQAINMKRFIPTITQAEIIYWEHPLSIKKVIKSRNKIKISKEGAWSAQGG